MMNLYTFCAALIPLLLYGIAITALAAALFRKGVYRNLYDNNRNDNNDENLPNVSVIIPFRNEAENLPPLIESLKKQNYTGMMEIVFVNDGSEDNGVDIITGYIKNNDNISIKIIDLHISYDTDMTSKQQALDLGVKHSSHPLLLFTDADMVLAPDWAETLVNAHKTSNAALVFGHTSISRNGKKRGLFTLFEAYQLEFLFAFAYAFSKLNVTGSCMGNNILIDKDIYVKCGGQRGVGYSIVEDRALWELLRKKGFKTAAAEPFRITAATRPSRASKEFFNQTSRWACGGLRPGGGLFWAGLLLLIQNIAVVPLLLSIISGAALLFNDYPAFNDYSEPPQSVFIAFWSGIEPAVADLRPFTEFIPCRTIIAAVTAINFLLTWAFLALAFGKIRSPAPRLLYPLYYLFMMAETVILALLLLLKRNIEWKGRNLFGRGGGGGNKSYLDTCISGKTTGGPT